MILLTQVNHWATNRPEKYVSLTGDHSVYAVAEGDYFFLNTNRISEMVALSDGISTRFRFNQAPDDHRCAPDIIECNSTVAQIEAAANVVYPSKFLILPIFPTNDISRVLIDTPVNTVVEMEDVAYIYATPRDIALNVTHCVYYDKSFKRVSCILNYSFAQAQSALSNSAPLLDMDENIYSTVVIGTQEWIVGNLRTTTYADGTAIPNLEDTNLWVADVTGAYCWYDNDIGYKETYGGLYNWYAATSVRGLAVNQFTEGGVVSAGWRIPTMVDWAALTAAAGGGLAAGGHLKEMGLAHWDAPNTGATDTYGYRMMGNGNRWVDAQVPGADNFDNLLVFSDTWSADEHDVDTGDSVYAGNAWPTLDEYSSEKYGGMAVRCVRDI